MSEYCVVVAQGSRARFFTLEPSELPEMEGGPNLVEQQALTNTEHQAHEEDVWADIRRGRNRSPSGNAHGYDEHRKNHDDEMERRFAKDIAKTLNQMAAGNGTRRVVLCAEKRMLGFLRPSMNGQLPGSLELREVPKDLTRLTSTQLHQRLADQGYLPRRRPPTH
ncbi:protein required for attachment to host cells [Alkalispirillum mobile]|uniref:Protein required for attachment to host cells n=1 Tax=Alkalispirillum mobile TaxID=85925 RepID=A0A498BW38_9GAMM|nr:host attachment protein [Alkalispirillum mobile]RLK47087.1 protein required for attachment to host cells [Alkalispirillum mobile]